MTSKASISTRIARRLVSSEAAYHHLRRAQLLAMFLLKRPHETDFEYFREFDGKNGLFIDVGANSGQSAVSFALYNSSFSIHSFEPYQQLEPSLRFTKRLLGERYSYSLFGLSDVDDTAKLYVPVLGNLPLLARASTSQSVIEALIREIEPDYGRPLHMATFEIELRTFDSLNLKPDIVKIDVEGAEPRVLRGMERTLREIRPLLLIERSSSWEECMTILRQFGYLPKVYEPTSKRLTKTDSADRSTNFFAVPT